MGCDGSSGRACSATWTWDGKSWRRKPQLDPEGDGDPPAVMDAAVGYDAAHGRVVLVHEQVTWLWDGMSWKNACGGSVRRRRCTMEHGSPGAHHATGS